MPTLLPARRGVSLIEILVGLLLALLTGAALFSLISSNYMAEFSIKGANTANTDARQALDTIADSLRNAKGLQTGGIAQAIIDASGDSVQFYVDTNGNDPGNNVGSERIYYQNSCIWKQYYNPDGLPTGDAALLVSNVRDLSFTYFVSSTYNSTVFTLGNSPLSQIGYVDIQVRTNVVDNLAPLNPDGSRPLRALRTSVRLRNSPYSVQ